MQTQQAFAATTAEGFYYRVYLNGQATNSYVLGTNHIVPYELLPASVRCSIEGIIAEEGSKLYSETGDHEGFFADSNDSEFGETKFNKFVAKNPYALLDIDREILREKVPLLEKNNLNFQMKKSGKST